MKHALLASMLALAGAGSAAQADIVASAADGFEIKRVASVAAPPGVVWQSLTTPQTWWSKDHTWSGDAANLYLDRQATGCFCERLPDKGSVEHARIVFYQPSRQLRLVGALGPLQAEAVTGTLTFTLEPEGDATRLTMDYVVAGKMRAGGEALAPAVDQVLGEQLERLRAAAEVASSRP